MNTETTEYTKGWVFYDAECPMCRGWVGRHFDFLLSHGFHPVPLQTSWVWERLGLKAGASPSEMRLVDAEGRVFGGADAFLQIARAVWWTWPLYALALLPGVKPILRNLYRRLAARRHCSGSQCGIQERHAKPRRHGACAFFELP